MGFTFNDLNLKNVEVSGGGSGFPVGKHIVKVKEAKLVSKPNGATQVEILHESPDGLKATRNWITVHNPNSSDNTRIGQEQLKALLVHGGHHDPDNIGTHGINSLVGLHVGISVVYDDWKNQKEGVKDVYTKVKSYVDPLTIDASFRNPVTADPLGELSSSLDAKPEIGAPVSTDDDIPF